MLYLKLNTRKYISYWVDLLANTLISVVYQISSIIFYASVFVIILILLLFKSCHSLLYNSTTGIQ